MKKLRIVKVYNPYTNRDRWWVEKRCWWWWWEIVGDFDREQDAQSLFDRLKRQGTKVRYQTIARSDA